MIEKLKEEKYGKQEPKKSYEDVLNLAPKDLNEELKDISNQVEEENKKNKKKFTSKTKAEET